MRIWLDPAALARLGITASEVISAVQSQNTVNSAGQIGANPCPTQRRLATPEEFGNIVARENPDGCVCESKRWRRLNSVPSIRSDTRGDGRNQGNPDHTSNCLALVIFVVYVFLQGWRATLIPHSAACVDFGFSSILSGQFWGLRWLEIPSTFDLRSIVDKQHLKSKFPV